jgi:hypothetical protein
VLNEDNLKRPHFTLFTTAGDDSCSAFFSKLEYRITDKMANDALCALLKLPAELRLRIYEFVIPEVPLFVHQIVYSGLLYACKQTRSEIEPIILKDMATELTRIAGICLYNFDMEFVFDPPSTLRDLENLITTARSDWQSLDPTRREWNPVITLSRMHFESLVIKVVCKHDIPMKRHKTRVDILTRPLLTKVGRKGVVQVKSLTVDYSSPISCPGNIQNIMPLTDSTPDCDVRYSRNEAGNIVASHIERLIGFKQAYAID